MDKIEKNRPRSRWSRTGFEVVQRLALAMDTRTSPTEEVYPLSGVVTQSGGCGFHGKKNSKVVVKLMPIICKK